MTNAQNAINDIKAAVIDAVQVNYFQFKGRAARPAYWWFILAYMGAHIVLALPGIEILPMIFSLAMLMPSLGLGARRLHDINMSGWWMLIGLIPLVGWAIMIYWMVQPGTAGANDYGPAPTVPTTSTMGAAAAA